MKHVYPVFHVSICCDLTLDAVLFKVFRPFLRNEDIFGFHSRPSVICTADPGTFAGSSAEQLDQIWVSRSLVGKCRALPAFTPRIVQKNQPNVGSSIYIYIYVVYIFILKNTWMVLGHWDKDPFFLSPGSDGYQVDGESSTKKPTRPKTHVDPKKDGFPF